MGTRLDAQGLLIFGLTLENLGNGGQRFFIVSDGELGPRLEKSRLDRILGRSRSFAKGPEREIEFSASHQQSPVDHLEIGPVRIVIESRSDELEGLIGPAFVQKCVDRLPRDLSALAATQAA